MTNREQTSVEREIKLDEFEKNTASMLGYNVSPHEEGIQLRKRNTSGVEFIGYIYPQEGSFLLSAELRVRFVSSDWDRKNPPQKVIDAYWNLSDAQNPYRSKGHHSKIRDVGDCIIYPHNVAGNLNEISEFLGLFKFETFEARMDRGVS